MIVTSFSGQKEVTCLLCTNQYSNEVANLLMIHVLVVFALIFSCGVLCRCSVITLCNEINRLFQFMLTISSASSIRIKSKSKLITHYNLPTSLKKL